jgi:hypothetical protein
MPWLSNWPSPTVDWRCQQYNSLLSCPFLAVLTCFFTQHAQCFRRLDSCTLAWLRQRSRYFRAISVFTMKVASDLAQPDCCYYLSTLASVFAIFHWRTHISTCRSVNSFLPLTTLYVRHIVTQYVNVFDTEMKTFVRLAGLGIWTGSSQTRNRGHVRFDSRLVLFLHSKCTRFISWSGHWLVEDFYCAFLVRWITYKIWHGNHSTLDNSFSSYSVIK